MTTAARGAASDVETRLRSLLPGTTATAPVPEPVTVTVARVVRPEHREAFERWAEDKIGRAHV